MAGKFVGSVDHSFQVDGTTSTNNIIRGNIAFKIIYDFFAGPVTNAGYGEIIAWQKGFQENFTYNNALYTLGTGNQFYDEPLPFGQHAFFVYKLYAGAISSGEPTVRQNDMYLLIQYAGANRNLTNTPGNPGFQNGLYINNYAKIGISIASCNDNSNPWNGTLLNNGNDLKGTPVWVSPSPGDLNVLPRSNMPGGTHETNRENLSTIFDLYTDNTVHNIHCIGSRDTFIFLSDYDSTGKYKTLSFIDCYETLPGITPHNVPIMLFSSCHRPADLPTQNLTAFAIGQLNGQPANNNTSIFNGGIFAPVGASRPVCGYQFDRYGSYVLSNTDFSPNKIYTPNSYDMFKKPIVLRESPDFSLVGYASTIREVNPNTIIDSVNQTSSSLIVGDIQQLNNVNFAIPWSGPPPKTVGLRTGRQF